MTSSEFVRWNVFLKKEVNFFHREDYYFAAIIWAIFTAFTDGYKGKIEDWLMKWEERTPVSKEEERKAKAELYKQRFKRILSKRQDPPRKREEKKDKPTVRGARGIRRKTQ